MEFTDDLLEAFGETFLDIAVPTQLSLKTPLVFRMMKELKARGCLPWTGSHRAELCFDEALTNAMVHGNKLDPARKIHVRLFGDGERWGAIVEDEGAGFGPDDLPRDDRDEFLFRESGRGIRLMDAWLDSLRYTRKGNCLCMVRRRQIEPDQVEVEAAIETEAAPAVENVGPVSVSYDGDEAVLTLHAARVSDDNVDTIREAAAGITSNRLALDMSRVEYISSVGLSTLVGIYKQTKLKEGRLVLTGVQPSVRDILQSARLMQIFRIQPDLSAALAELRKAS